MVAIVNSSKNPAKCGRLNKESVGLAGEYAVASELCKRGLYAQLTLGNHKKTDILVESPKSLFRVSVKTKTGYEWPRVTGIWAKNDLLVLVDLKGKRETERPDFYVLNVNKWKLVLESIKKEKGGKIDRKTNTLYWDAWEGNNKGWRGCAVRIKDVSDYMDHWPSVR